MSSSDSILTTGSLLTKTPRYIDLTTKFSTIDDPHIKKHALSCHFNRTLTQRLSNKKTKYKRTAHYVFRTNRPTDILVIRIFFDKSTQAFSNCKSRRLNARSPSARHHTIPQIPHQQYNQASSTLRNIHILTLQVKISTIDHQEERYVL